MTRHFTAYYAFGGGTLDGDALKNALNVNLSTPINSVDYAASGAGIYAIGHQNFAAGFEGQIIVDQDAGPGYETAVGVVYSLFNVGYRFKLWRLTIYPMIGIGGGTMGLRISEGKIVTNISENPPDLRMIRSNILFHLGTGVELRVGGTLGLIVGVRFGYLFAPFSKRKGIRGPYFRLVIGSSVKK